MESDGSDFAPTSLDVPLRETGEWQRIEFRLDEYHVARWSKDENDSLDLPLKNVVLVAHGLKAGEDYCLEFDDLEISRPGRERIRLLKLAAPSTADAGADIPLQFTLAADEPLAGDYALFVEVCHNGKPCLNRCVHPPVPTGQWKVGQAVEMPAVTMHVPLFSFGGRYEARARLGWTDLVGDQGKETLMTINVAPRRPQPIPKAEIRTHGGVPTLFINGKPNAAMTYMTYNRQETKYFRDFKNAGVDLATFSATSDHSYYGLAPDTWLAPDVFDYGPFDHRITSILEANPDAYLFPRIYISAPAWWCEKYPTEVAKPADTLTKPGAHFSGKPFATPASEKWREDTAMALRKFIEHVRSSPYADRVIGYHIASLHTEEWFYHNFWGNPPSYWGYTEPDRTAFVRFLKTKYATVEALRKAWNNPTADFDSATVPAKEERLATDLGFFRDPARSRRVIDFYLYYNDIIAETIEYFARVVKEATNRESLYGVFYGYLFELSGSPEGGHLGIARLLRSPDIDFFTAPSSYGFRALGTGCSAFMSVTEGVKSHGKFWFNENDYRTHLVPQKKATFDSIDLKDLTESLSVQKRELAHTICLGTGMWWFDMGGGWYDTPDFMKAIAEMNAVGERSIHFDRSSVAEIAVVVDEDSMCYREPRGALARLLLNDQRNQLHRVGAPFDFVFLNDLEALRTYKLYIFLNTFRMDERQRAAVNKVVKRHGKTALWVYAPGFIGDTLSNDGISSLTGIPVGRSDESLPLKVKITEFGDDLTKGTAQGTGWGSDAKVSPVFFCDDPSAKALGAIDGLAKTGLAVKRSPEWTSVYCAAPNIPAWLLRSIARTAGVHIYNDADDPLYVSRSFLAIHTNVAGERALRFPQPTSLFEVFEQKQIARDAREVKLDLPAKHTAFYFLGAGDTWDAAGHGAGP